MLTATSYHPAMQGVAIMQRGVSPNGPSTTHRISLDPEMGGSPPPPGSWRGTPPLSIRFGNPEAVFRLMSDVLAPLRPLRPLRYLILPFGLAAAYGALFSGPELDAHITRIALTLSFAQSMVLSILTANLLGKTAQGVTMARLGADTNEFGIRLAFGVLPKFYILKGPIADLGFAGQRMCYAAPLLLRLWMFIAGMLIWVIIRRSGSGVGDVALALGLAGLSSFLFTANPLLPADGYRWLTAWLERPRLRQDGLKILRMLLTFRRMPADMPRGEFWLLLLYAVFSLAFTAFVFLSIMFALAFVLELQLQGTGVILFCILMSGFVAFLLSFLEKRRNSRVRPTQRKKSRGAQASGPSIR